MNEPLVAKHPTPPVNRHWALAVILLLPVWAIVCIDIVLIYFQITYAPSSAVASDVSHSVLTNTAWVLDKISVGGGTVLFVVTLELLFFVQSLRQFLLCAVALTVHLATVYFVDPAVLTPLIAVKALGLYW
jgi:hypothetical protein